MGAITGPHRPAGAAEPRPRGAPPGRQPTLPARSAPRALGLGGRDPRPWGRGRPRRPGPMARPAGPWHPDPCAGPGPVLGPGLWGLHMPRVPGTQRGVTAPDTAVTSGGGGDFSPDPRAAAKHSPSIPLWGPLIRGVSLLRGLDQPLPGTPNDCPSQPATSMGKHRAPTRPHWGTVQPAAGGTGGDGRRGPFGAGAGRPGLRQGGRLGRSCARRKQQGRKQPLSPPVTCSSGQPAKKGLPSARRHVWTVQGRSAMGQQGGQ